MATDFSQDSVSVFSQSCGGSVKNTESSLHFRPFSREHPDHVRNRELFKKFVNSVATVTKIDGVSNVVLRKKYRGYVPGGGSGRDGAEPWPAEANNSSPAVSLAPPGDTDWKSASPAAGIVVETSHGPAGKPVQVGNQVPGRPETPDQSEEEGQNNSVYVPAPVGHQDHFPAPIRGQEIPKEDFNPTNNRGQDAFPEQIRGQHVPPQDMSKIRGHIVNRQDYTPRREEIPHQDVVHVPIRRLDNPHQGIGPQPIRGHIVSRQDHVPEDVRSHQDPNSESLRGHIVSRQDHVPDPVESWGTPSQGAVPEPAKGHIVSRQDHVPVSGQQVPHKPVPDHFGGSKTSHQERFVEPFRGHIVNHQGNVPVRGQQVPRQNRFPSPNRRWDSQFQDPVPRSGRGHVLNRVPEPVRGQAVYYQDPSRGPLMGWDVSAHNPAIQPLRGQQIPPNLEPFRGQIHPTLEPLRRQIPQNLEPHRGQIPQNLEHLRGQIPQNLQHLRGQIPQNLEPHRGQIPPNLGPIRGQIPPNLGPIRGQIPPNLEPFKGQIPQNLGPIRGQIPQNLEPLGGQIPQNLEPLGGQIPQNLEPLGGQIPQNLEPHRGQIPQNLEPLGGQIPQNLEPLGGQIPQNLEPFREQIPQNLEPFREQIPQNLEPIRGQIPENLEPIRGQIGPLKGPKISFQDPDPEPLHQDVSPEVHQIPIRRLRHRKSYKSAVSQDEEEEEEEEEEVPSRRGSAEERWPLNGPLSDSGRASSASSPCITESLLPPSSSSGRKVPQIYVQNPDVEVLAEFRSRRQPGPVPAESTRRSLPLEAERPARASEPGPDQNRSSISDWPPPGASRADKVLPESKRSKVEPGGLRSNFRIPSHQSMGNLCDESQPAGRSSPSYRSTDGLYDDRQLPGHSYRSTDHLHDDDRQLPGHSYRSTDGLHDDDRQLPGHSYRSTDGLHDDRQLPGHSYRSIDHLHDDRQFPSRGAPFYQSTGDLYDDVQSSDGSIYSVHVQLRPSVARRVSSRSRSRNCRSSGTDSDQLHQEEPGDAMEAARLERLNRISSSSSLPHHSSSSSSSSCATPPRCPSPVAPMEVEGRKEVRRNLHPHNAGQSPVPSEAREHAWMVKAAAGAWPDIYTSFREDSSSLNRQDFICGFTVSHWIAKHGDHRVLNTSWYGVDKAGSRFDVDAKSTAGQTPLHVAAIHGNKSVLRSSVKKFGADVKSRDTAGKRPWQYSRDRSHEISQMSGAPPRVALAEEAGGDDWKTPKQEQRRRPRSRHHLSSASSAQRPSTVARMVKVNRSSSIAALFKHKSHHRL